MSFIAEKTSSTGLVLPILEVPENILQIGKSFNFSFNWEGYSNLINELIAIEIGNRYPETGYEYSKYVLDQSIKKNIWTGKKILIAEHQNQLAGFTVITLKQDQTVKFGPTIIVRTFRNNRLALNLRLYSERFFRTLGYVRGFSTCRADNKPAIRYVQNAGYELIASLPNQYQIGVTELVYSKIFNKRSAVSRKSSKIFYKSGTLVRKRGGSLKLNLANFEPDNLMENLENIKMNMDVHRVFFFSNYQKNYHKLFLNLGFELNNQKDIGRVIYGFNME